MTEHSLRYTDFSVAWTMQAVVRDSPPATALPGHPIDLRWAAETFTTPGGSAIESFAMAPSTVRVALAGRPDPLVGRLHSALIRYVGDVHSFSLIGVFTGCPPLTTDELIAIGGAVIGVEASALDADDVASLAQRHARVWVDTDIAHPDDDIELDAFFDKCLLALGSEVIERDDYVLFDVWESFTCTDGEQVHHWTGDDAGAAIAHLKEHHGSELMGALSLYPGEWPYRDPRDFERLAGPNVAIDVDDLVLTTEVSALVIGSYALRSDVETGTDWGGGVLAAERAETGLSWPEYSLILDAERAKRTGLRAAHRLITESADRLNGRTRATISRVAIDATTFLSRIDQATLPRFPAHALMQEATALRLKIDRDRDRLARSIDVLDRAIANLDTVRSAERATALTRFVTFLSVASLVQLMFLNLDIPYVRELVSDGAGHDVAAVVLSLTLGMAAILGVRALLDKFTRRHDS